MKELKIEERKEWITVFTETALPEFVKACKDSEADAVLLHQDAFAADYQTQELLLLGCAVKYAGIMGKELRIIGVNRSTLGEEKNV